MGAFVVVWAAGVVVGVAALERYSAASGAAGQAPTVLPVASSEEAGRFRLICFLHPRCPCSRATLSELERLEGMLPERLELEFVVVTDGLSPAEAERSDLWVRAARLGRVRADEGGGEASAYGAMTSGHCVLYRPDGTLAYAGGVTPSRGHEGASEGRAAILAAVLGERPAGEGGKSKTGPVFGCPLSSEDERALSAESEEASCCRG